MEGDWVCTACGITNDGSGWFDAGRICNPSPVPCYACGAVHIVTYRLDVTVCSEQALADEVRATVEAMHSANANDGDEDDDGCDEETAWDDRACQIAEMMLEAEGHTAQDGEDFFEKMAAAAGTQAPTQVNRGPRWRCPKCGPAKPDDRFYVTLDRYVNGDDEIVNENEHDHLKCANCWSAPVDLWAEKP